MGPLGREGRTGPPEEFCLIWNNERGEKNNENRNIKKKSSGMRSERRPHLVLVLLHHGELSLQLPQDLQLRRLQAGPVPSQLFQQLQKQIRSKGFTQESPWKLILGKKKMKT